MRPSAAAAGRGCRRAAASLLSERPLASMMCGQLLLGMVVCINRHPRPCSPLPPAVNNSTTVTRTTRRFGDFYRPLAPSDRPYLVRVAVPSLNWTRAFNVTVPASGAGSLLNVLVPL